MTTAGHAPLLYRDEGRPVAERVEDLLGRMTLEEKAAQLGSAWIFQLLDGESFSREQMRGLAEHGLGHVTRLCGASSFEAEAAAAMANEIQGYLVEETRLGIPAIVHEEICSGLMARGSTVFPQAIGVASTWAPELSRALAAAVRAQMRAIGAHQGLSPVLDICRDPRWGRTEETFGEDPHLVARMGVEFVRGLQGDDLRDGVVATAKHLVGYGASEGGMNWAPARIGACELHDVYLHPFEAAVRDRGAALRDERLQRGRRHAVRRGPRAPDGAAAGPVAVRRLGRLRLLRGAADRDVPPARRGRRARRGDGARGRDRCRASADRLLRRTPARGCPPRPRRRGDPRRRGPARARDEVRARSVRAAVRRRGGASPARSAWRHNAPSRRRSCARASCS